MIEAELAFGFSFDDEFTGVLGHSEREEKGYGYMISLWLDFHYAYIITYRAGFVIDNKDDNELF